MESKYQKEKMTPSERKKKISVETENPVPSVPNRAHTEMSAREYPRNAHALNIDEVALGEYASRYKDRMNDSKRRAEKE